MYDICCVGHITSDKVINSKAMMQMPGGTAFYFSHALQNLDIGYLLVTSVAETEMRYVTDLRNNGLNVDAFISTQTVYFEDTYADNQDHRTQRVLAKADPFTIAQLQNATAGIFHLGPLLADDIPAELVKYLSAKGKVSLDVQGYLREVKDQQVHAIDWAEKKEILQYISILKADETEMQVLTGYSDVEKGARQLAAWGVKEVVITNGSLGSIIYSDGIFYDIPAYPPHELIDATGCGDTYIAGYLYARIKGAGYKDAGQFAASMSSLKMESPGPFTGNANDVYKYFGKGDLVLNGYCQRFK